MSECFVYVISIDDLRVSKVGISFVPQNRLQQLQTASPHEMRIAHKFKLPHRHVALYVEQSFHAAQANCRLKGEWFRIDAAQATLICCVAIDSFMARMVGMDSDARQSAWRLIGAPSDQYVSSRDWQIDAFQRNVPPYQPKGIKERFVWRAPVRVAPRVKLRTYELTSHVR